MHAKTLFLAAAALAALMAAAAVNDAAAVMAVVQKFDKGFNTGDASSMKVYAADAIIIDDYAPHVCAWTQCLPDLVEGCRRSSMRRRRASTAAS